MSGLRQKESLHDIKKPVKIYDCTKKELIKECESVTKAARYLGLTTRYVNDIIKQKVRNKTNKLGLIITCR